MERCKKITGYTILMDKKLGEGSFGKVYLGEKDHTGQKVAIKTIEKNLIDGDAYMKTALFSEMQIIKTLHSPHIVECYDIMESPNYYYLCQEFCDGGNLAALLAKRGPISQGESVGMLIQICTGFLQLIKQGIVHRDLKPENILISQNALKIADFGFSKKMNNPRLKHMSMVGTPLYMSPQLLKGEPYSSKCDIWALGFIYYQILHGKTPWYGSTQYELMENIETKPLQFSNGVSPASRDFLMKCLQYCEQPRWDWDQLLRHGIFRGQFNNYLSATNQQFEDKFKHLMGILRFQVTSQNIDLGRLFTRLGYNSNAELNFEQFEVFLKSVDPSATLTKQQQRLIFQRLDANNNNSISLTELAEALKRNRIPMQAAPPNVFRHIQNDQPNQQIKRQIEQKLNVLFTNLAISLDRQRVSVKDFFRSYDLNLKGVIGPGELENILCRLDNSMTKQQVQFVYQMIDSNGDGGVSFDEFHNFFCKVTGTPRADVFCKPLANCFKGVIGQSVQDSFNLVPPAVVVVQANYKQQPYVVQQQHHIIIGPPQQQLIRGIGLSPQLKGSCNGWNL